MRSGLLALLLFASSMVTLGGLALCS